VDLQAETARVRAELACLRTRYLSRLLADEERLARWQGAVVRLEEALPAPGQRPAGTLEAEDFAHFLHQRPTPGHALVAGRIRWEIGLFIPYALDAEAAERVLGLVHPDEPSGADPWRQLQQELRRVQVWFLHLSAEDSFLWNALCWLLPPLAQLDPGFARTALDREGWQVRVLNNPNLDEEQRSRQLHRIGSAIFGHVLNNALLHVLAALANNHWGEIEHHLDHPNLVGSYTGLMPTYLFAVLFQKVATLRELAAFV
jgi:hypothetical protein